MPARRLSFLRYKGRACRRRFLYPLTASGMMSVLPLAGTELRSAAASLSGVRLNGEEGACFVCPAPGVLQRRGTRFVQSAAKPIGAERSRLCCKDRIRRMLSAQCAPRTNRTDPCPDMLRSITSFLPSKTP